MESHINDSKKNDILKNVFNVALSILFSPPPTTPTFDVALQVCVCVCVCVCDYFFHFVSCSVFLTDLFYFCLVTIVLSCQSCLQNVKQKLKNLSLLLLPFFFTPTPLVIITIICKDWKNHVIFSQCARSSMCTNCGRERRGKTKKLLILQKQIQFQTLNITLILAGGSLLFCFV